MSITVSRRYGDSTITVGGNSLAEALEGFKEIDELPTEGPKGGKNLQLRCRHTKDYQFFEVTCADTGQVYKLGMRKSDGALFPKRDDGWQPPYEGKGQGSPAPDDADDEDPDW